MTDKKPEMFSFVIPCYNSTDTLDAVVEEICTMMQRDLPDYLFEIILVNDGSPNGTTYDKICSIAKENSHVKGINLARNFGQPSAVMAGMNHAKGDYVVCGDDDGQTPYNEFPRLFEKITEGYDAVEGKFTQHEKRSLVRVIGTKMNEWMATFLINKPKGLVLTTYWVVKRFVALEMIKYSNSYPYLGGLMMRTTQNVVNVGFAKKERLTGKSGYNIKKMIELWLNGFTSFSVKPLRIAVFIGIFSAFGGLIFGIVTIIRKLLDPTIAAGYSSILAVMLIMFGVMFLLMGMMGEYVGRIYMALNNTPQFVIKETIGMDEEDE